MQSLFLHFRRPSLLLLFGLLCLFQEQSKALDICTTIPSSMHIEKILPAPPSGEKERLVLQSSDTKTIPLEHFQIRDESGKTQKLSGELAAKDTLEIIITGVSLNNDGDSVFLESSTGVVLDSMSYTTSQSGVWILKTGSEEAPTSTTNTPSQDNTSPTIQSSTNYDPNYLPMLSEWMPDPVGVDTSEEWIELWNPWGQSIILDGLWLDDQDGGSSPYALKGSMEPDSYLLISIENSKITLNNSVDEVRLLDTQKIALWTYAYSNTKEGQSFIIVEDQVVSSTNPSPSAENPAPNQENEDSSSTDSASDSADSSAGMSSDSLDITEVFPNPTGADEDKEWIEITNGGSISINLKNWIIRNDAGKEFKVLIDLWLEPNKSTLLQKKNSKLSLKNSASELQLLDPWKNTKDRIQYDKAPEGRSYSKIIDWHESRLEASLASDQGQSSFSKAWEWLEPSPGKNNPLRYHVKGELQEKNGIWLLDSPSKTWPLTALAKDQSYQLFLQNGNLVSATLFENKGSYDIKSMQLIQKATTPVTESTQETSNTWVLWIAFLIITALLYLNRKSIHLWLKTQLEQEKKHSTSPSYTNDFFA